MPLWVSCLTSCPTWMHLPQVPTFCGKKDFSSTNPLKVNANLCLKRFMPEALLSGKLQVTFLSVKTPLCQQPVFAGLVADPPPAHMTQPDAGDRGMDRAGDQRRSGVRMGFVLAAAGPGLPPHLPPCLEKAERDKGLLIPGDKTGG